MALPSVTINRLSGGIGRQAAGEDYFSGFLFYFPTGWTLPTGFQSSAIHICNSITDLEALGVDGLSSDETKATGTIQITDKGTNGDVITISFTNPITSEVVTLGAYTKVSGDTTATLVATAIKNAINALTYIHGATATSSTDTVTITVPPSLGVSANSGSPVSVSLSTSATMTYSLTQPSGGVGSYFDVLYYHVSEAFRMQGILNGKPQGQIWVGCYNVGATTYANFTEVETMQAFANGGIKQLGVYAVSTAFATTHVTALQARATAVQGNNMPLSIVYQGDFSAVSDWTTVSNLSTLSSKNVSVTIGQDNANKGRALYKALGKSVGMVGTTLGAVALAKVSESLEWRGKFNAQDSLEYTSLALCNGNTFTSFGSGLTAKLTQLDLYRYIFLMNEVGLNGSFFNQDNVCISTTSDYAYITDNRTIDKAARLVRTAILPALGSPLTLQADGTLAPDTVDYFQGLGDNALSVMLSNSEVSAYETVVDPSQDVLSTGELVVTINIVPKGVARNITVNIGFKTSLN